jgi:dUTP pyrophosphatase
MKIEVKKLRANAILPEYQTKHSAGMDLHACIDKPIVIKPGKWELIPTGISLALPDGYESHIRCRSGLAFKHGVGMVNGMGTIDADYRGEYGVLLINYGKEDFVVNNGDRVAQLVINRYEKVQWQEVEELNETARGAGGFGSPGK